MNTSDDKSAVSGVGHLQRGQVLNDIWEVGSLHARGGMSEIYEGRHINTDERVAIKLLLPHFASDPRMKGVLLSEARKMTKIRSNAVVHYVMMGEDPRLNIMYIVMEYIVGPRLDQAIQEIPKSADTIFRLMRRLSSGLRAAHRSGVFHRDLSPDNILLPNGSLDEAKIIDFGIAKDIDPNQSTIIGNGFAGKLGFAAPEQFGDYGGVIGPWTDAYSLGLVMLAVLRGNPVNMGSTFAEAVDRRRTGIDISEIDPEIQIVLRKMIDPNPEFRFRSMDELIDFLEAIPRIAMSPVTQVLDAVGPDWPCSSEITAVSPDLPKDDKFWSAANGLKSGLESLEVSAERDAINPHDASAVVPTTSTLDASLTKVDSALLRPDSAQSLILSGTSPSLAVYKSAGPSFLPNAPLSLESPRVEAKRSISSPMPVFYFVHQFVTIFAAKLLKLAVTSNAARVTKKIQQWISGLKRMNSFVFYSISIALACLTFIFSWLAVENFIIKPEQKHQIERANTALSGRWYAIGTSCSSPIVLKFDGNSIRYTIGDKNYKEEFYNISRENVVQTEVKGELHVYSFDRHGRLLILGPNGPLAKLDKCGPE